MKNFVTITGDDGLQHVFNTSRIESISQMEGSPGTVSVFFDSYHYIPIKITIDRLMQEIRQQLSASTDEVPA